MQIKTFNYLATRKMFEGIWRKLIDASLPNSPKIHPRFKVAMIGNG